MEMLCGEINGCWLGPSCSPPELLFIIVMKMREPFILHAMDVMNNLAIKNNERLSTIAVLHGILERTDITERAVA